MKKQLLTLMLMLVGMAAWAQSGWTDPSSEYQSQTVVYVAIDCGNYDLFYDESGGRAYYPELAAYIGDELREVVVADPSEMVSPEDKTPIYTLRVGGTVEKDQGKEITFKIYDDRSGIIYPLTYEGEAITWTGDATADYPSNYYTMSFAPATEVKLFTLGADMEIEINNLSIRVNETKSLDNYYAKVYDAEGNEIEVETPGFWDIEYGPNRPYVQKIEAEDGSVQIKGMQVTPVSEDTGENSYVECAFYVVGSLYAPVAVQVLPQYFPVTDIAIEDINYYWPGYGRLAITDEMVTYNNNESVPTYPGVKVISSSNTDIVSLVGESGLNYHGIGSSVITVAAIDDEEVTTTFTINILSALSGMHMDGLSEEAPYTHVRYSDGEEYLQLPSPLFDWVTADDGGYIIGNDIDESYTMSSNDESVLVFRETEDAGLQAVSLKKGTVTVTYTSNYDPTKSTKLTVVITQSPTSVAITQVGAVEIETNTPAEPIVDVAVGQAVTAIARVSPNDADIESFEMQIVDANNGALENVVEVSEPVLGDDGTYQFTFTFVSVPTNDAVYVRALVNGQLEHRVRLNVRQSVTSIELGDVPSTIWLGTDGVHAFSINVKVSPDDATDKSLTVTSSNEKAVTVGDGVDGVYTFDAVGKGTAVLTFTSVDNPSVSVTREITVKRKVEEIMVEGLESELYNDGVPMNVTVTILPEDADYDMSKLSYRTELYSDFKPEGWEFITIEEGDVMDAGMLQFIVTGRSLCNNANIVFAYDATEQGDESNIESWNEVRVLEKVRFNTKWNWVSFVSAGLSAYEMEGSLEEARSQTSLIIHDPNWGLFGNLSWMDPSEAYKINMKEEAKVLEYRLMEGGAIYEDGTVDDKVLEHGWNWESYPYEYSYPVANIFDATQFNEGDIILSKEDGMTTVTDGAWEGNLETLRPNQGYLIYSNTEGEYSVTMPNRYKDLEQGYFEDMAQATNMHRSVWSYDGSRFANTMAIIGKFNIEDAADYTIGAFVGDECRGEGKFVNGRAYITAAGEAGEVVTLRLYNTWTGEYIEVEGAVEFTDMAGSVKAPVCFKAGAVTGIENAATNALTIQGHVATAEGTIQILDVQGKVIAEGYQRIDFSHLGQGVYVVKAGDVSRKVIK